MQERIYDWIENPVFATGLQLARELGEKVPTYFDRYLNAPIPPIDAINAIKKLIKKHFDPDFNPVETSDKIAPKTPYQKPDSVRQLEVQGAKAYDHYEVLKTELREADTDKQRHEIALLIMEQTERIDSIYERLRAWEEKGEIPLVIGDNEQKVIKMMLRINSLKSRISRLKSKTDDSSQQELKEKTEELDNLIKILNL